MAGGDSTWNEQLPSKVGGEGEDMKIKIGNKYVTGINNSTKTEPISLILEDKTESVWTVSGLHFLQRKFSGVVFDVEV